MATKTTIQNLINNKIRSNPDFIDKDEHADVEDSLLSNSYGTVVTETYTSITNDTPNTTPNGTTHYYVLRLTKQGRTVTVNGTLTNNTTSIVSNQKWLDIDAGEYTHDANLCVFNGVTVSSSKSIRCKLVGSALTIIGAMGALETIEVNFTYTTLD